MKECALMGCELPDDVMTLQELRDDESTDQGVRNQAGMLIDDYEFEESDSLCEECFWK